MSLYCADCADKNSWPKAKFPSLGVCDECGKWRQCNHIQRVVPSPAGPSPFKELFDLGAIPKDSFEELAKVSFEELAKVSTADRKVFDSAFNYAHASNEPIEAEFPDHPEKIVVALLADPVTPTLCYKCGTLHLHRRDAKKCHPG